MFSHIMIGSNDIARSKKFYDALFAAMGGQPGAEDAIDHLGSLPCSELLQEFDHSLLIIGA